MKLLFRSVRSKKRKALLVDVNSRTRKEIEKYLDKQVKPTLIKSHEFVTSDWEHKVEFGSRKQIKEDSISVYVFPTGENAKIYEYVDLGTKPHQITGNPMKFKWGGKGSYVPKTLPRPARTVSGGGYVNNPQWVTPYVVEHPGIEGRKFSETITKDIEPQFKKDTEILFRSISKKLEE